MGILGGVFGFIGGFAVFLFGAVGEAFNASGAFEITVLGIIAILVSITGIIGAVLVYSGAGILKDNVRWGGIVMIISAIIGFIFIFMFYLLAGLFLVLGGVLALLRK